MLEVEISRSRGKCSRLLASERSLFISLGCPRPHRNRGRGGWGVGARLGGRAFVQLLHIYRTNGVRALRRRAISTSWARQDILKGFLVEDLLDVGQNITYEHDRLT